MKIPRNWLKILLFSVLVLGILFRFINLDHKVYWFDEVYTSFRLSGYTVNEVYQDVGNRIVSVEDLQKYQQINAEKSVVDTVKGLAIEEPQLTPLYFILLRFWVQLFGDSVATIRSFSAWISLLVFPSAYWLCKELFRSSLTGWIAIALLAVSPLQLLYAQEARPYSIWVVTILIASAALLRAIRTPNLKNWSLYTLTVALGLYTHLLFALVAIAHGLYVLIKEQFRWTQTLKAYLLSAVIGVVLFLPWILITISNQAEFQARTSWQSESSRNIVSVLGKGILNLSRNFVDFNLTTDASIPQLLIQGILILATLCLVAYTLYWLIFKSQTRPNLFCLCLIAVPALILILPDLILGGSRSTISRYLLPTYVGVQIAMAYLFATKLKSQLFTRVRQKVWALIFMSLISLEIFSCLVSLNSQTWWHSEFNDHNPKVANLINQAENPLVVTELERHPFFDIVSLSYLLAPTTKILPVTAENHNITTPENEIFVFGLPKENWKKSIEQASNVELVPVYQNKPYHIWLWKFSQPQR